MPARKSKSVSGSATHEAPLVCSDPFARAKIGRHLAVLCEALGRRLGVVLRGVALRTANAGGYALFAMVSRTGLGMRALLTAFSEEWGKRLGLQLEVRARVECVVAVRTPRTRRRLR